MKLQAYHSPIPQVRQYNHQRKQCSVWERKRTIQKVWAVHAYALVPTATNKPTSWLQAEQLDFNHTLRVKI